MVDVSGINGKLGKFSLTAVLALIGLFAGGELWIIKEIDSISSSFDSRLARLEEYDKAADREREHLSEENRQNAILNGELQKSLMDVVRAQAVLQQAFTDIERHRDPHR